MALRVCGNEGLGPWGGSCCTSNLLGIQLHQLQCLGFQFQSVVSSDEHCLWSFSIRSAGTVIQTQILDVIKKTWSSLCLFVFRLEDFHLKDSDMVKHSHCMTVTSLVLWLRSDYWSDLIFYWSGCWRAPSVCLWRWLRTGSGKIRVSSGWASSAGEATEKWHHCSGDEGCDGGERRLRSQGESSVCLSVCLPVCLFTCLSV